MSKFEIIPLPENIKWGYSSKKEEVEITIKLTLKGQSFEEGSRCKQYKILWDTIESLLDHIQSIAEEECFNDHYQ